MKVRIAMTVEVDEQTWMAEYGQETQAEVRADVQAYVASAVADFPVPLTVVR